MMLRIKYPQFLNCCKYVPQGSDLCVLETIESLAYGNQDSKQLAVVLEKNGNNYENFINTIIERYDLPVKIQDNKYVSDLDFQDLTKKKKAIKDIMVENYLIRMKHEKGLTVGQIKKVLLKINLRLFLKMLPLKNILVEDGEIVAILDPIVDNIGDCVMQIDQFGSVTPITPVTRVV